MSRKRYGFNVLIEVGTDCIPNAHLLGPRFDEVIHVFALAIRKDPTADHLKMTMFAYPTGASYISSML